MVEFSFTFFQIICISLNYGQWELTSTRKSILTLFTLQKKKIINDLDDTMDNCPVQRNYRTYHLSIQQPNVADEWEQIEILFTESIPLDPKFIKISFCEHGNRCLNKVTNTVECCNVSIDKNVESAKEIGGWVLLLLLQKIKNNEINNFQWDLFHYKSIKLMKSGVLSVLNRIYNPISGNDAQNAKDLLISLLVTIPLSSDEAIFKIFSLCKQIAPNLKCKLSLI